MKFRRLLTLIFILFISGCSTSNDDLQQFDSFDKAVDFGMQDEDIDKEDVIGKIKLDNKTFFFYTMSVEEGLAVGVAVISKQNDKYEWYRSNPFVIVKNKDNKSVDVSWDMKTKSGNSYIVYTGLVKDDSTIIKTIHGNVTPEINSEKGIYYYVEPVE